MNKTILWCLFICLITFCLIIACTTSFLSDKNIFLKNFVNHEIINFLGVIVTITLGSIANIHLELNKLEELIKKEIFKKTRYEIKQSAFLLIIMLVIALFIVIIKPLCVQEKNLLISSLFNAFSIIIIFLNIFVLFDIIKSIFNIKPNLDCYFKR